MASSQKREQSTYNRNVSCSIVCYNCVGIDRICKLIIEMHQRWHCSKGRRPGGTKPRLTTEHDGTGWGVKGYVHKVSDVGDNVGSIYAAVRHRDTSRLAWLSLGPYKKAVSTVLPLRHTVVYGQKSVNTRSLVPIPNGRRRNQDGLADILTLTKKREPRNVPKLSSLNVAVGAKPKEMATSSMDWMKLVVLMTTST